MVVTNVQRNSKMKMTASFGVSYFPIHPRGVVCTCVFVCLFAFVFVFVFLYMVYLSLVRFPKSTVMLYESKILENV